MPFAKSGDDGEVKIAVERDCRRAYLKLPQSEGSEPPMSMLVATIEADNNEEEEATTLVEPSTPRIVHKSFSKWVKIGFILMVIGVAAFVFLKWVIPFLMDKELMPIINWETSTFSSPVLAVILFATVALFPTLLLPSTPSMWVAGMTFGYVVGFLLIMFAVAIGVSLPFFIGNLFYTRIQGWMERYPKKAAVMRLAGEGDWMNQFQAVFLIRVSPFPYILYNYCAVATNVQFGPYFFGSMVGMVPDVLVAIYTGILINTLADASQEHHSLSKQQITFDIIGFVTTVTTTVICTIYAKRRLKRIQMEEDVCLRDENAINLQGDGGTIN